MDLIHSIEEPLEREFSYYKNWQYKNTALLVVSVVALIFVLDSEAVTAAIEIIGSWGYLGAFITGIFFTSTFTIAPAIILLYSFSTILQPLEVAAFAGAGAVIGDYILFRFLKDRVFAELRPLVKKFGGSHVKHLFKTPYFAWLMPLVGGAIIASPLPDELGVGILGLSRLKTWQFLVLSFVFNTTGILIITLIARAI